MKQGNLRDDLDLIPFRYSVHASQHNERMFGRMFGLNRESREAMSAYQQRRRFAGSVDLAKPETWLWAYSVGRKPAMPPAIAWKTAVLGVAPAVLVYDHDLDVFTINTELSSR